MHARGGGDARFQNPRSGENRLQINASEVECAEVNKTNKHQVMKNKPENQKEQVSGYMLRENIRLRAKREKEKAPGV